MKRFKLNTLLMMCLAVSMLVTGCGSSGGSYSEVGSAINSDDGFSISADVESAAGFGVVNDFSESKSEPNDYVEDRYDDYGNEEENTDVDMETEDNDAVKLLDDKLIYTCDIDIETQNFVETQELLTKLIKEYGIIIESEYYGNNSYDWYMDDYRPSACQRAELSLRIPSTKYHEFVNRTGELGHVVSKNSTVENLSSTYRDNETRLRTLKEKRDRLESLLGQAATVTEIIELENSIEQVCYEIEKLESANMYIDLGVMYSYINIDIEEVGEYTTVEPVTKTFGKELIEAFKDSWTALVELIQGIILTLARLSLVAFLPMIILIAIAVICIKLILKKEKKVKSVNKNEANLGTMIDKQINSNKTEE